MIQTAFQSPTRYIKCPACGEGEHVVSHLAVGTHTALYCDECGVMFSVHVITEEWIDAVPSLTQRKVKTLVTLRSNEPVTLIVKGMRFENDSEADDGTGSDAYFYDEHTCPSDYLSAVVKVISEDGKEDPHGIFEYVKTEPWRDLENE